MRLILVDQTLEIFDLPAQSNIFLVNVLRTACKLVKELLDSGTLRILEVVRYFTFHFDDSIQEIIVIFVFLEFELSLHIYDRVKDLLELNLVVFFFFSENPDFAILSDLLMEHEERLQILLFGFSLVKI